MRFKLLAAVVSLGLFASVGQLYPTSHLQCLMPMASAQGIPSPPEGNPGHGEPAPGSNCVHNAASPDHNCPCHRTCTEEDGKAPVVTEDPKCRSFCYKDHCACPTNCQVVS